MRAAWQKDLGFQ